MPCRTVLDRLTVTVYFGFRFVEAFIMWGLVDLGLVVEYLFNVEFSGVVQIVVKEQLVQVRLVLGRHDAWLWHKEWRYQSFDVFV